MDGNVLDLDLEVDLTMPAVKTYAHQISLSCYGRGKRLCDLQIPEMPASSFIPNKDNNNVKNNTQTTEARVKTGRGRGRSRRSAVHNEKDNRTPNPDFDRSSLYSDQSSQDSEKIYQDVDNQSEQLSNYSQSKEQETHQESDLPARSKSPPNKSGIDSSQHTPVKNSASVKCETYDINSPPLKILENWTVHPPSVIQFEGIPMDYDLTIIYELMSSYAPIIDWEEQRVDGHLSMRMKFNNADDCDLIEMNMDKSDFTGTGSIVRCKHLRQ